MSSTYRLAPNGVVIETLGDGGSQQFPYDAGTPVGALSGAAQRYREWLAEGHAPEPAAPPPPVYTGGQRREGRVTTIGTTAAELFRATLAPLTAYAAMVHLVGIDNANGAMRYIRATIAAKRLNGGAILVNDVGGSPARVLADHRDGAANAWSITPSVSGNDFVITVGGAIGRTIDWHCRIEVESFTPGGAS